MKEKTKNNPKRRFRLIIIILCSLILAYPLFVITVDAFEAWLENDPFTPLCDVPHLELVYAQDYMASSRLLRWHQGINPEPFVDLYGAFITVSWSTNQELYVRTQREGGSQSYQISDIGNGSWEILNIENSITDWLWSPDEMNLAKLNQARDASTSQLWIKKREDIQFSLVLTAVEIHNPIWSPNSNKIAFIADGRLYVYGYQNEQWLEIFSVDVHDETPPLWSPDSELVAQGNTFIDVYNVSTQEEVWRIEATGAWDWGEKGIVVHTATSDEFGSPGAPSYDDIFLADVETRTIEWLADSNNTFIIGWSQGNEALLFSPEPIAIWLLLFLDDNEQYPLPNFMIPQFTPDGRYISYQGENGWLYLFDIETRSRCRLFQEDLYNVYPYDWRIISQP